MLLSEERHALAQAGARLAARGLVIGTSGNLSVRRDDLVVVTPTGGVISELTAEQMTVIRLEDGAVVDGDLAPTSEVPMHLAVYKATGTGAITHTHATTSTALGLVTDEIPLVHYTMLSLGGAVRVADYACYGTEALAALVVKALEFKQAALMRNHGSIALGSSLAKAVDNLELVEWAAQTYHQALLASAVTGRAPRELNQAEQEEVIMAALSSGYGTTKKIADTTAEGASGDAAEQTEQ
ncbi:class II aldolase/adducin family protein [Actinospica durhamensis]|uniref:Class II aldolase/adducin family protein n=1 Tax=Actinospica durhamensis TaxID=1508375 RepID=A0A941EXD3_9ACTN|nr:class II aldolase/adducin family protein [Actinospica durhamensis]MBR7836739.1 class II aldolase/adducin family protein [Actinospica durhamensis]